MAMLRIEKGKDNPFVMIDKTVLRDTSISWKAKGILTYLLSLPDDWKIYESELSTHSCDGIKSTRSGIKELINAGYIVRRKIRDKGRFMGYEYTVYEHPTVMPKTENGKTENGKRHTTNTNLTDNEDTENNDNHNGATSRSARTTLKNDSVDSVDNEPINRESLDTTKRLTAYYLASYKHFLGIEHPKLKRRQWDRVTQTIMDFSDEHGTDLGDMGNMVKRHFERSMETDYNINHFATEGVLTNLFYEAAY